MTVDIYPMTNRQKMTLLATIMLSTACLAACSSARSTIGDGDSVKQEAATAWNGIVRMYFVNDCDGYRSLFATKIKVINPYLDTLFDSAPLLSDQSFCDRFGLRTAGLLSFDDYVNRFRAVVYSRDEYLNPKLLNSANDSLVFSRSSNSRTVISHLAQLPGGLTDDDYLVIGDVERESSGAGGLGAPFIHVLRKTADGWKVFAVLP